jgi:hypothetical protein
MIATILFTGPAVYALLLMFFLAGIIVGLHVQKGE